jgi:hypothetical protein
VSDSSGVLVSDVGERVATAGERRSSSATGELVARWELSESDGHGGDRLGPASKRVVDAGGHEMARERNGRRAASRAMACSTSCGYPLNRWSSA